LIINNNYRCEKLVYFIRGSFKNIVKCYKKRLRG